MAGKVKSFSTLVENQLPEFISSEYPNFVGFVKKYYEQLETPGQPLDLINNLMKYQDIDTYEKKLLKESSVLVSLVETSEVVITVENGDSFPEKNGYVMIGEEVIFYQNRIGNAFRNCYRNVSATTKLGDLYNASEYKTVPYAEVGVSTSVYSVGSIVTNISNLFLYAFVKNFESQYLGSFPENSLKPEVDKAILIKNIKKFYASKGTEQSIKFIFNSIVSKNADEVPSVYYPKDSTYKSSSGEWISNYSLKVKIVSGDPKKLIGQKIIQSSDKTDSTITNAFAYVDNVIQIGENTYEIILDRESVVGEFNIVSKTNLVRSLSSTTGSGGKINVYSTAGWSSPTGYILIGGELISYSSKNINQFVIGARGLTPILHANETEVYTYSNVYGNYTENNQTYKVQFIILGILYSINSNDKKPYSSPGDIIQSSKSGFESTNRIIFNKFSGNIRWKINENFTSTPSPSALISSALQETISDVSAIFEDEQYYYITSSGFPSHSIGNLSWNQVLSDQKHLKLLRKYPVNTTEIYKTTTKEVGILINGTTINSYKDEEEITFGKIVNIEVTNQGSGYQKPPYVLIIDSTGNTGIASARSVLAGEVVERIIVDSSNAGFFPPVPSVEIVSGRNAVVEAVVTGDEVTALKIINPGEYYSSPPRIIIKDSAERGRSASFTAIITNDGKLSEFVKNEGGKFYTQDNISVIVEPVGSGATAISKVKTWAKNRFEKLKNNLDQSYGYYFLNNLSLGYGYSYLANPKLLRIQLNDNINSLGNIPATLTHSPIIGYAFDGNPIYGPYGYTIPTNSTSSISRMQSSYTKKTFRVDGPSTTTYPLGSFVEDYAYNHRSGSLDQNNGRYCVTPEYPEGTYAYFVTIDSNNVPVFPYIVGDNYYSIPVDSNYNKQITQNDLPKNISRLRTSLTKENGLDVFAYVDSVNSGTVNGATIDYSTPTFSNGSIIDVKYFDMAESSVSAQVSAVKGKIVSALKSSSSTDGITCTKLTTETPVYLFNGDLITQSNTGFTGLVVGNIIKDKTLYLENTTGKFTTNSLDKITSSTVVISLIVDRTSSYQENSDIILTNGKQVIIRSVSSGKINVSSNPFINGEQIVFSSNFSNIISGTIYYVTNSENNKFGVSLTENGTAISLSNNSSPGAVATSEKSRGIVLESTENSNTVTVKVTRGVFSVNSNFYLKSFNAADTVGSIISEITNLSSNIKLVSQKDNVAIVSTTEPHNLSVGDNVNIDIFPDDLLTQTTLYVRKRIYQKIKLNTPSYTKKLNDTGIGRLITLNSGADYASTSSGNNTYNNVELIFKDQSQCRDVEGRIVGSSSSLATIGKIGNSDNAKATVNITNGLVTSITITSKGKNYKKGDLLTISPSALNRLNTSTSTVFFTAIVDHVGFGLQETRLFLNDITSISISDYLKIGDEIVLVTTINSNLSYVDVVRAQKQTTSIDHVNQQLVSSESPSYNFTNNYRIGPTDVNGTVLSYDKNTQELTLGFDISKTLSTINSVNIGLSFFDSSTPKKLVGVNSIVENSAYKFEFSYNNISWVRNPIISVQKYYRYKFDTSNTSLSGSFLEFSPSGNYNIITTESTSNGILPGNLNSFTTLKIGFGPNIQSNQFDSKKTVNFSNYYYFDKNNIIDTDKSYLKLIEDNIQGNHLVTYITPSRFVYEPLSLPQNSGSGNIKYYTNSSSAIGEIEAISITNGGVNLTNLPSIIGARPGGLNECLAEVQWNSITKNIIGVTITNAGRRYSKPKAILIDGDGILAEFLVNKNLDNSIASVIVLNTGRNYSYKPTIKIIETDLTMHFTSSTIGTPNKITILQNGSNFNADSSISKIFTTPTILIVKNFTPSSFSESEIIEQYDNSVLIASAIVSKGGWSGKTNILKVEKINGEFQVNLPIIGKTQNKTALVIKTFVTLLSPNIKSYYDNVGYYASDASKLNSGSQKITDSYYYQDYSYVIRSKTPIDVWRDLIKQTVHPAGFKVFGEVTIENTVDTKINTVQPKPQHVSIIQLWDPQKNKITVENTYRTLTQTQVKVSDLNLQKGKGSVFIDTFDDAETASYEIYLTPEFNGYFDASGNRSGNKTFTIKILGSSSNLSVPNEQNAIISLDGIVQQPQNAFTISGSQITFKEAPLGYRNFSGASITSSQYKEGVDTPSQKFVGKVFRFKDLTLNTSYFKKIKDISSQFDGVKTSFELKNKLDNSNITLDFKENLLVSIDGVLQRSGITPIIPIDRSYYIRKNVVPNEIVFLEPPKAGQYFSAQSISNYERVGIDELLIDGQTNGPFIMRSLFNNKTLEVFNDKNILIFVDGVFQKKNKAYEIRGSSVIFAEPIQIGQNVNILYFYGRNSTTSITAFKYDDPKFFNAIQIDLSAIPSVQQYADKIIYQGSSLLSYSAIGRLKSISVTGSNTSKLIVLAQNGLFNNLNPITIVNGSAVGLGDIVIPSSNITSVSVVQSDEDTNEFLTLDNSGWLIGSELVKNTKNTFDVGDKIRIKGEKNFRNIISTPEKVYKQQYNQTEFIETDYYGKITVSPNDEIVSGEGLVVYANIQNGKIVSLDWNDRKYGTYGLSKIQPGAYTYEDAPVLQFIPQPLRNEGGAIISPAQGGGAQAFVIIDNGEVIDVVLTNGGSNYISSPKILITRNYDIIKKAEKNITTSLVLSFSPQIKTDFVITSIINLQLDFAVHEAESIISRVEELNQSIVVTTIVTPEPLLVNEIAISDIEIFRILNVTVDINSITTVYQQISTIVAPTFDIVPVSTITSSNELNKFIVGGVIDNYADLELQYSSTYSTNVLGVRLATFESNAFVDSGVANVSGISLEQFNRTYENITIEDFILRPNSRKAANENTLMNLACTSINEYGAHLQIGLSTTDTIIYVASTNNFLPSGRLIIESQPIQATATASFINQTVNSVTITSGGSGYETTPIVNINSTSGSGATATANLSSTGFFKRFNITNAGSGYTYAPIVTLGGGLAGQSATATISGGAVTGISLDGITYDLTNTSNVYQFGNGTAIVNNGTGVGTTGGFNIGSSHLRFGEAEGVRFVILNKINATAINKIRVYAVRGNQTNGGETPDIVDEEDLRIQYQIAVGAPSMVASAWTDLGIVIPAVPNGTGTGVLDNYDFVLPSNLQSPDIYFRLFQRSNSGAQYDHYGIKSVTFLGDATVEIPAATVTLSTNPLQTGATPVAATADVILGKRVTGVTVTAPGINYVLSSTNISFTGGSFTIPATATPVLGGDISIIVTNSGFGYSSATVTINGGGGTGATANASIGNNNIQSITMTSQGSGYTTPPTVVVSYPDQLAVPELVYYSSKLSDRFINVTRGYLGSAISPHLVGSYLRSSN